MVRSFQKSTVLNSCTWKRNSIEDPVTEVMFIPRRLGHDWHSLRHTHVFIGAGWKICQWMIPGFLTRCSYILARYNPSFFCCHWNRSSLHQTGSLTWHTERRMPKREEMTAILSSHYRFVCWCQIRGSVILNKGSGWPIKCGSDSYLDIFEAIEINVVS